MFLQFLQQVTGKRYTVVINPLTVSREKYTVLPIEWKTVAVIPGCRRKGFVKPMGRQGCWSEPGKCIRFHV